jgi:hypothetical protein
MSNYLTRLAPEEQRVHTRRPANISGMIYYLKRGVRGHSHQPCRVLNISESGCLLHVAAPAIVPEHLYLVFETLKAKFSCAVIDRTEHGLDLRFLMLIPSDVVDRIMYGRPGRRKVAPARG